MTKQNVFNFDVNAMLQKTNKTNKKEVVRARVPNWGYFSSGGLIIYVPGGGDALFTKLGSLSARNHVV